MQYVHIVYVNQIYSSSPYIWKGKTNKKQEGIENHDKRQII